MQRVILSHDPWESRGCTYYNFDKKVLTDYIGVTEDTARERATSNTPQGTSSAPSLRIALARGKKEGDGVCRETNIISCDQGGFDFPQQKGGADTMNHEPSVRPVWAKRAAIAREFHPSLHWPGRRLG